ncbi:MAG: hypothetical protein ACTSSP_05385 [Candidatus Asgardarchaeia archaeon]
MNFQKVASKRGYIIDRKTVLEFAIRNKELISEFQRAAFELIVKKIIQSDKKTHIVSTPSLFRWNGEQVEGFDDDIIKMLNPKKILIIIDNVLNVRQRIINDPDWFPRFDRDENKVRITKLAEWREEAIRYIENIITKLSKNIESFSLEYILQFSRNHPSETFIDILFNDSRKKRVYLSYPMTGFESKKDVFKRTRNFARALSRYFIVLDPGTIDDWRIVNEYDNQIEKNSNAQVIKIDFHDPKQGENQIVLNRDDIENATNILRKQIVKRDFNMVFNSHAIVVYHHSPNVSAGVMSEIAYAYRWGKPIYIYYPFSKRPSPFIEYFAQNNPSHISLFKDEKELLNILIKDYKHWEAFSGMPIHLLTP